MSNKSALFIIFLLLVLMGVFLWPSLKNGFLPPEAPRAEVSLPEIPPVEIPEQEELEETEEILTVFELLEAPVYDREIMVFGEVNFLGELFCPCFELTSNEKTITVWYDLMTEDDGTELPAVDVSGIENGDEVIVTGELETEGLYRSLNDFWATDIEKIE